MRIIFTFYFVLLSFNMIGQETENLLPVAISSEKVNPGNTIRIRCGTTMPSSRQPLIVIDGVPVESEKMKEIDPNDIESLAVLKDAAASSIYGCRAANGVIVITTKNARTREFQIKDVLDESNVAGATVCFVSARNQKDTLMFVSNDRGIVTTNKLKAGEEYEIKITSVGYKNLSVLYKNIRNGINSFSLEREIVIAEPVVVTSYGRTIKCSRNCCCLLTTNCRLHVKKNADDKAGSTIYPNPVQRGKTATIETNNSQDNLVNVRLMTIDGRLLLSQARKTYKGINRVSISIDNRWSAGVYFIQVVDDKGSIVKQEKIIIQ
jgi:TonB-dependent SusC/RagA subfamily outer membrane receptor